MFWRKSSTEKKTIKPAFNDDSVTFRQVDQNFQLHATLIPGKTEGMHVIETGAMVAVDSGLNCDSFNIIQIKNTKRLTRNSLREITNYFRLHERSFTVWINDQQFISGIENVFGEISLNRVNIEPGMAMSLESYQPVSANPEINIVIADSAGHVQDFASVLAELGSSVDENVLSYYELTTQQFLDHGNGIRLLICYQDGIPVSTIEMFPSNRVTLGFYNLATTVAYRGKGIGSAMMKFALNTAKSLGYKTVILQASEDGIGIYKKLGFEIVTNYFEYQ